MIKLASPFATAVLGLTLAFSAEARDRNNPEYAGFFKNHGIPKTVIDGQEKRLCSIRLTGLAAPFPAKGFGVTECGESAMDETTVCRLLTTFTLSDGSRKGQSLTLVPPKETLTVKGFTMARPLSPEENSLLRSWVDKAYKDNDAPGKFAPRPATDLEILNLATIFNPGTSQFNTDDMRCALLPAAAVPTLPLY